MTPDDAGNGDADTPPAIISEQAPAKINLYLHVLGRRADGYHLLDGLTAFADVGDRIEVAAAVNLSLTVTGPFASQVPAGDDNLVLRAARALATAARRRACAAIRLDKRLPVAAGIGGGSADAAATLRALAKLWRLEQDSAMLAELATGLGADVPMCLHGRTCFVAGVGERLDPAPPLPAFCLLLVNPGVPLPTPPVFARREGPFSSAGRFPEALADARGLAALLGERRNDLTEAAVSLVPEISHVLRELAALPGVHLARMSGSGATCFGLLDDRLSARQAARALAARHPDWWITPACVAAAADCD